MRRAGPAAIIVDVLLDVLVLAMLGAPPGADAALERWPTVDPPQQVRCAAAPDADGLCRIRFDGCVTSSARVLGGKATLVDVKVAQATLGTVPPRVRVAANIPHARAAAGFPRGRCFSLTISARQPFTTAELWVIEAVPIEPAAR